MSDVELVYQVGPDHEVLPVVYVEDNPLWILAGLLIAGALLVVVAVLGLFYIAGVWAAGRIARWADERGV